MKGKRERKCIVSSSAFRRDNMSAPCYVCTACQPEDDRSSDIDILFMMYVVPITPLPGATTMSDTGTAKNDLTNKLRPCKTNTNR